LDDRPGFVAGAGDSPFAGEGFTSRFLERSSAESSLKARPAAMAASRLPALNMISGSVIANFLEGIALTEPHPHPMFPGCGL
jgi:hypothetical protein